MKLNLKKLNFLSSEKYYMIIHEWNQTAHEYPRDRTVIELFEEQAARTPDSIAVIYEDTRLSYRELNEYANRLSRYLADEYSIGADSLAALCIDRSEKMIQAILGVMKTGAAYVPLAPDYPDERLRYILRDTGTKVILTNKKFKNKLEDIINDPENDLQEI